MKKVLFVITGGTSDESRALEGVGMATAMHLSGMVEGAELLLTGAGVQCLRLDGAAEALRDAVDAAIEAGLPVGACTKALNTHGLLDEPEALEGIRPLGSPTRVATALLEGWSVLTF